MPNVHLTAPDCNTGVCQTVIMHAKCGEQQVPYDEGFLRSMTDPDRPTGPWVVARGASAVHLVHEDFTAWLDPRPADRRHAKEAMI